MAQSKNKNLHVIPRGAGWAVVSEGGKRVTSVHATQRAAIQAGRELARYRSGELVIHGRDGRIRARDSYSTESHPPKEPRKVLFPVTPTVTDKKAIKQAVLEVIRETRDTAKNSSQR
jgi:hypothetical protein